MSLQYLFLLPARFYLIPAFRATLSDPKYTDLTNQPSGCNCETGGEIVVTPATISFLPIIISAKPTSAKNPVWFFVPGAGQPPSMAMASQTTVSLARLSVIQLSENCSTRTRTFTPSVWGHRRMSPPFPSQALVCGPIKSARRNRWGMPLGPRSVPQNARSAALFAL